MDIGKYKTKVHVKVKFKDKKKSQKSGFFGSVHQPNTLTLVSNGYAHRNSESALNLISW